MPHEIAYLIIVAALAATKPAAASSGFDFTSLGPLLGVVVGGLITALTNFFLNWRTNKQQSLRDQAAYDQQEKRDKTAYDQQKERDEIAYNQQKERETIAYQRALMDARRERLRSVYKVILNTAEAYVAVLEEQGYLKNNETEQSRNQRLDASLREALAGMNEALVTLTLENVGTGIENAFRAIVSSFHGYMAVMEANKISIVKVFTPKELDEEKAKVIQHRNELIALMQDHLKEFE